MILSNGTYGPNLSAASSGSSGTCHYGKPGNDAPDYIDASHVGAWNFPLYNSGGVDYAGDNASNYCRCVVDETSGTMTIHTATYLGSPRSLVARLYHHDGSDTLEETKYATTGEDIVFTIPYDGALSHFVDITDASGSGGKWGFSGFDWIVSIAADFSGTPLSGAVPLAVTFTDESIGPVDSWEWDFGDGSTSTEQNPIHVYTTPGTYTVTLKVTGGDDSDSEVKTAYVAVSSFIIPPATGVPSPGVWVDWGNDGFGTAGSDPDSPLARMMPERAASITDDITDDVISIDGQDGGQYDTSTEQAPGQMTIIVKNADGKYTPRNTGSPYFGLLKPGKKVWVGGTSNGVTYGVAAMFIKDIVPLPRVGRAQIICEDPVSKWQKTPAEIEFGEMRKAEDYRRLILTALGLPAYRQLLAAEQDILPVSGCRTNSAMQALEEVNRSTGSRHWVQAADDKDDHFYYRTVNRNGNLGSADTAVSLDDDDIVDITGLRTTIDPVYNIHRISPRAGEFEDEVEVWRLENVPMALYPTGTVTLYADFGQWCKEPSVTMESDGSGSASVTVTNYGQSARLDLLATGGTMMVRSIVIKGRLSSSENGVEAVAKSQASIDEYGFEREGPSVSADFLNNVSQAQGVAEANLFRSKDPRDRPVIRIKNRFDKALITHIGDVIDQTHTEFFLTALKLEVIGRQFTIDKAAKTWDFGFTCLETPLQDDLGIFILDSSLLDGPDVLGF